uniref:IBB domain-containing protein n=1 Tax=Ascaris lumbricoides TaxID=6252 RepID=A0A0M3HQY3_ASCLU
MGRDVSRSHRYREHSVCREREEARALEAADRQLPNGALLREREHTMLRARRTTREEEEGDDKSNEKKSRRLEIAETLQDKDLVRNSALEEL